MLLLVTANGNAQAATVRALNLPDGYTIKPEAEHRLMTVARDGTVFAIGSTINGRNFRGPIAMRWRSPDPQIFEPLYLFGKPGDRAPRPAADTIVARGDGDALMTVGQVFDGAYLGERFEIQQWTRSTTKQWKLPACAQSRFYGPHIFAMDDGGSIALTLDPSKQSVGIDSSNPESVAENLPIAYVVAGAKCLDLGSAILTAIDGPNVAGYIGYFNGKPAPWDMNRIEQQLVALRWTGVKEVELGDGVPYDITRGGLVVGATALPAQGSASIYDSSSGQLRRYEFATPHAIAWLPNRQKVELCGDDTRSVAWAVSEDRTIVGMEQMKDGKHYAFRWKNGRAQRLDDFPHPPGWRFESAYAIEKDGSIVGIGTYNGVATAFVWSE